MKYNEKVKAQKTPIMTVNVGGCEYEVKENDGTILLYGDGYCMGELFEEDK